MSLAKLGSLIAICAIGLSACGGGGGGGSAPNSDQTIAFATPGVVTGNVGSSFANTASGGGGSGVVTYVSSNLSVATVNATTGVVSALSAGTTTITATKAASAGFNSATTTYIFNVTQGTQSITFATTGTVSRLAGSTFTNTASGGGGTGAVTYASSNVFVATVDASTGTVTAVSVGTTIITATKAESAGFNSATATYVFNVIPDSQTIAFVTPGPVSSTAGTTFTNTASGGGGTGAVSYVSSSPAIATVNANTGAVSTLLVGSTTITATKAESTGFSSATASYTLNVTQGTQTISFTQPGPFEMLAGSTMSNSAVGGRGIGTITYTSSNTAAATVNSGTGAATAVANGTATITATKAADTSYAQATANYSINVVESAALTAWLGTSNSTVALPALANGARLLRSRDRNCNLTAVTSCTSGQSTTVAGAPATPITDTTTTLTNIGYHALQTDSLTSPPITVASRRFSPRIAHTAMFFNNKYWVLGGAFGNVANLRGDYWSSSDGKVWDQESVPAALANRWFHQSLIYDNKMWVIGGATNGSLLNDVWSTPDGLNWTQVTQSAALPNFATTTALRAATFSNAMWVVNGGNVYSSTDGATWTLRTSTGPGGAGIFRQYATLTAFNGKLWYIGGATGAFNLDPAPGGTPTCTCLNDVWSSIDGIAWTLEAAPPFTPRAQHGSFVLNNRLWVMGGRNVTGGVVTNTASTWSMDTNGTWTQEALTTEIDRTFLTAYVQQSNKVTLVSGLQRIYSNGVYQTVDGSSWTELTSMTSFAGVSAGEAISFNGELWFIGGVTLQGGATNEIWRSADGANWTRVLPTGGVIFPRRISHKLLVFNNRIWVIGGWNETSSGGDGTKYADVWSSADGVTWTQATAAAAFGARTGFGATVFDAGTGSKMWVIGGEDAALASLNDVWSSSDGVTWTAATMGAGFSPRFGQRAVTFNNAMWMIGGAAGGSPPTVLDEVWSSTDGVNWTPRSGSARFVPRIGHGAIVHNGRIWVTGGNNGGPYPTPANNVDPNFNDVWSSSDGLNWTQDTAAAPFEKRSSFGIASLNGELWLINGLGFDRHSDVWRSSDGANWRTLFKQTIRMR